VASNGHEKSAESLKREAAVRRAALRRTASALEDKIRVKGHQVSEAVEKTRHQVSEAVEKTRDTVERTKEKLEGVDSFVHRHPYVLIGGSIGLGLFIGYRRQRRPVRASQSVEDAVRVVLDKRRPSVFRSLLSGVAAMGVRYGLAVLSEKMAPAGDPVGHYADPLLLPPGRPDAE
jgi:ElaB/YqjD/DUF883 family membrane-anchored ribosome-binding protein